MDMESMIERTAMGTDGKGYTFLVDKNYFIPDNANEIFKEIKGIVACVFYTEIKQDKGERFSERFGVPRMERYDNGQVGYQQINFFSNLREAENDFASRSRLSPKIGTIAYADVFMITKNGKLYVK